MQKDSQTSGTVARPPVVAILGHVDHGKTSLLDKIRNSNLTAREAGGITQSTGSFSIKTSKGQAITFIDTPGHAAFEGMRARGANIADLAILVVAADDGVMTQTKQSIQFIRDSKTPFIVAISKIDLPGAQIDKAKNQLLELEIIPEDLGGDVVVLPISSKTGEGIEELLEMITLTSEMNNITGDPNGALEAYILESGKDMRRGVVANIIVKNGTLRVGDMMTADGISAKVRGLFDEQGKPLKELGLSQSAEVIGFSALPPVGAKVITQGAESQETQAKEQSAVKVEGFPVIVKADTAGSLEAILGQLGGNVGIVLSGLGDLIESDVRTASTTGATIVGFNVKVPKDVARLADEEKVKIYTYRIIYELLDDIERWIKEKDEAGRDRILGKAQIIAQFPHDKKRIAGCKVTEGRVVRSDRLRLVRGEENLGQVKIVSMKKLKQEVDKVEIGDECGILFEPQFDFQIGDVLESVQ